MVCMAIETDAVTAASTLEAFVRRSAEVPTHAARSLLHDRGPAAAARPAVAGTRESPHMLSRPGAPIPAERQG